MYRSSLIESRVAADIGSCLSYGIAVCADGENSRQERWCLYDVTVNKERLALLVEQCNRLQLSPIHLKEIVEDFLLSAV